MKSSRQIKRTELAHLSAKTGQKPLIFSGPSRLMIVSTLTLLLFTSCVYVKGMSAQDSLRVINLARENRQDPVRIVGLIVGGKPVQRGVAFEANGDWVQNITVLVRNNSTKIVTCVRLVIEFPELEDQSVPSGPLVSARVTAGEIPDHALYTSTGTKLSISQAPPISVKPGETAQIPAVLSLKDIKTVVEPYEKLSQITRCTLSMGQIFFADQSRWSYGTFALPDPQVPGKYNTISSVQFNASGQVR